MKYENKCRVGKCSDAIINMIEEIVSDEIGLSAQKLIENSDTIKNQIKEIDRLKKIERYYNDIVVSHKKATMLLSKIAVDNEDLEEFEDGDSGYDEHGNGGGRHIRGFDYKGERIALHSESF